MFSLTNGDCFITKHIPSGIKSGIRVPNMQGYYCITDDNRMRLKHILNNRDSANGQFHYIVHSNTYQRFTCLRD